MTRLAPASLVLGLALAASAPAGALDDRDGPKTEVGAAVAPFSKGGGAPGADGSAQTGGGVNRSAAKDGNPLWMIPLSALNETRDRPLFSVSRRPPAPLVQAAAPPPVKDPAPPPPAPPERPTLALIGTIIGPTTNEAMVRDTATQAVTRIRQGEAASGWLLKTVKLRSIVVEKGEQSATLALPEPLDASSEQLSPNPLALGDRRNRH